MKFLYFFLILLFFSKTSTAQLIANEKDKAIFNQKLILLQKQKTSDSYTKQLILLAKSFLGTPYKEKTLEIGTTESLVVNLRGLDCTTFVENTLAFSLLTKNTQHNFSAFTENLKQIRYRNGVLDGYASRLHYFTDWIRNNEKKGLVKNITSDLGGIEIKKTINFMGTHRNLYPFLENDKNFKDVLKTEAELAKETLCYLPLKNIENQEKYIDSGDIIALATSIKGLDVTHTGFALKMPNNRIHLLHASSSGEVKISEEPLVDYLKKIKNNIGIIVARPL